MTLIEEYDLAVAMPERYGTKGKIRLRAENPGRLPQCWLLLALRPTLQLLLLVGPRLYPAEGAD
jgi:hypothetical protein